jgi:hypothetical protein
VPVGRKESDPELDPDPDPSIRGADPGIRDPCPHQNVTDPQHWRKGYGATSNKQS